MYPLEAIRAQLINVYRISSVITPHKDAVRIGRRTRTLIALAIDKGHGFKCRCCEREVKFCGEHIDGSLAFYVSKDNPLTVDHKTPRAVLREQGAFNPGTKNFQILCRRCNLRKGMKT